METEEPKKKVVINLAFENGVLVANTAEGKVMPKPGHNSCYGRGYLGIDLNTHTEIPCPCLISRVKRYLKGGEFEVKVEKGTVSAGT